MNVDHYNNILRQCVAPGKWVQGMEVLKRMKLDSTRPDVVSVGCVLAACAMDAEWNSALVLLSRFEKKILLDSNCYSAVMQAANRAGQHNIAASVFAEQERRRIPILSASCVQLLEAGEKGGVPELVYIGVKKMHEGGWNVTAMHCSKLQLCYSTHLEREALELEKLIDLPRSLPAYRYTVVKQLGVFHIFFAE